MAWARSRRDAPIAIPAYACYDIATAAVGSASPVCFYDLDPETLAPDTESLRRAIEGGVAAVVLVHLFGVPVDMPRLAPSLGATLVIEDAAQAAGSELNDRPLGSFGSTAVLSFGRGKGVTGGKGGALLVRNPDDLPSVGRSERLRGGWKDVVLAGVTASLSRPWLYWLPAAVPFLHLGETVYRVPRAPGPMSKGAAALLQTTLSAADAEATRRRENAARLSRLIRGGKLTPVAVPASSRAGYLRLPVLAPDRVTRDSAARVGARLGVAAGYPTPLPELAPLVHLGLNRSEQFPGASALADRLLTLPVHGLLGAKDLDRLAGWIADQSD